MSLAELSQGRSHLTSFGHPRYDNLRVADAIEEPCCQEEDQEEEEAPPPSVQSKTLFRESAALPDSDVVQQNIGRMVRFHRYRTERLRSAVLESTQRPESKRPTPVQPNTADQVRVHELLARAAEAIQAYGRTSPKVALDEVLALLQEALETIQPAATTMTAPRTVLESFDGYVDSIDGDNAYVTLESRNNGDVLYGEFPASELLGKNISEQSRFLCETVKTDNGSHIDFRAVPEIEVTDEEVRSIAEKMRGAFLSGDGSVIEY